MGITVGRASLFGALSPDMLAFLFQTKLAGTLAKPTLNACARTLAKPTLSHRCQIAGRKLEGFFKTLLALAGFFRSPFSLDADGGIFDAAFAPARACLGSHSPFARLVGPPSGSTPRRRETCAARVAVLGGGRGEQPMTSVVPIELPALRVLTGDPKPQVGDGVTKPGAIFCLSGVLLADS